jgi:hypothetical protein
MRLVSQVWSWALASVGLTGLWIAASRPRLGWSIALASQVLWVTYAVATRQWGFIATAVAYAVVYTRLLRAKPKHSSPVSPRAAEAE